MNRFLLFIAITCGLLIGSVYLTQHSDRSTSGYESDSEFFSSPNESNQMEPDNIYSEGSISNDTYEEESSHSDVMYDSELKTGLPEENTADTPIEKEEISNTTSNDHEGAEVKEDYEDEFWEGYAEEQYSNEDYSFRYANPPLYQSDINTDYGLALYQSDFIESIERGEFPGLVYKMGIPMVSSLHESGNMTFIRNMDKSQYYMMDLNQIGVLLDNNEDLTLAGMLLPIETQLEELVAMYGEPQIISDSGPHTYTYFTKEHYRLIFHADPSDNKLLRFLEYR